MVLNVQLNSMILITLTMLYNYHQHLFLKHFVNLNRISIAIKQ